MLKDVGKRSLSICKSVCGVIFLGLTANLTACSFNKQDNIVQAQEKPTIVASHDIICDFVTTIVEDTINLTCLIDDTQSPHTYRPTPSDRKAIEEAQVILYGGYQLEPNIIQLPRIFMLKRAPKFAENT